MFWFYAVACNKARCAAWDKTRSNEAGYLDVKNCMISLRISVFFPFSGYLTVLRVVLQGVFRSAERAAEDM